MVMFVIYLSVAIVITVSIIITGSVLIALRLFRGPRLVFITRRPHGQEPSYRPSLPATLEKEKCTWCSGGTQWHNPETSTWGPIPRHLLYRLKMPDGDFDCRPPLHTGLRACNNCAGLGGIYRDISAASPSPYLNSEGPYAP